MRARYLLPALLVAGCGGPGLYEERGLPALPAVANAPAPPDVEPIEADWYPVDPATVAMLAGERSFEVTSGLLALESARVAADQAQRAQWPSFTPHVRFFRLDGLTQATEGSFVDVHKQNLGVGGGISLTLDVVEKRALALASRQRAQASEHASVAGQRAAVLEALERYDDLVRAQNDLAISRELLEGARSVAAFETARERSGSGLAADRLRAEAQEAAAEGDVLRAEADFHATSTRLAEVLRIAARTTLYAPAPTLETIDLFPPDQSLEPLVDEALASRPELAESVLLVEAAEAEERGAKYGPWFPQLVLGATVDGFGPNLGRIEDQSTLDLGLVWGLSPTSLGRRREAHLAVARERLRFARRREAIEAAVVRNFGLARVSRKAVLVAQRRVEASLEALDVVRDRREAGTALVVEVLEAQREVALARQALLAAQLENNRAQRRLQYAVGR